MSDPLGFVSGSRNPFPARGAGHQPPGTPAGGVAPDPGGASFKDALLANLNKVNSLQSEANRAIEDLQTGKRNDVEGVVLATAKADLAFQTLLAVRNKVQAAIDEVKQIRV